MLGVGISNPGISPPRGCSVCVGTVVSMVDELEGGSTSTDDSVVSGVVVVAVVVVSSVVSGGGGVVVGRAAD